MLLYFQAGHQARREGPQPGRGVQDQHQQGDEGSADALQGPAVLHRRVHGLRGSDRDARVPRHRRRQHAHPALLQARSRGGKVLDSQQPQQALTIFCFLSKSFLRLVFYFVIRSQDVHQDRKVTDTERFPT